MNFRPFSIVAKPSKAVVTSYSAVREPLAPSLLLDPAFSADPLSHPLSITSHEPWVFNPPVGHPPLQRKSRRAVPILASDAQTIDSDTETFHLIPPPNSPVNGHDQPAGVSVFAVSDAEKAPQFVVSPASSSWTALPSLKTRSAESISTPGPSPLPDSTQSPLSSPELPAAQAPKAKQDRSFMTFLSRRKASQKLDAPAAGPPKLSKALTLPPRRPPPQLGSESDVTRPSAPRYITTEPVLHHHVDRPAMPTRSSTIIGGTATPGSSTSTLIGSTAAKRQDGPANRMKDLDRIDELDETNPWGISLHHDGPFEAATQAIRRPERKMPLAFGNSAYHQRAMLAHGNNYIPPQAPVGGSLNLSPGQILPRNFAAQYGQARQGQPLIKDAAPPPTAAMMLPPQKNTYIPSLGRRSTYQSGTPVEATSSLPAVSNRQPFQPPARTPMSDFHPLPTTSNSMPSRRQSHMASTTATPLPNPPNPLPPSHPQFQFQTPHPPPPATFQPPLPILAAPAMTPAPTRKPVPPHNPSPQPPSHSSPNGERPRPPSQLDLASIGIGMAMLGVDSEDEDSDSEPSAPASRRVSFTQTPADTGDEDPHGSSHHPATPPQADLSRRLASMPDIEEESFQVVNLSARQSEESISVLGGFEDLGTPPPYTPTELRRKSITPPPPPVPARQASLTPPPQPLPQTQPIYQNPNHRHDLSRISEDDGSRSSNHSSREAARPPRPPPVPMLNTVAGPPALQNLPNPAGQQMQSGQISPPRRSPDRMPPPSISDGRSSTQPSSGSSYTSSQLRMGPPPPRHLPKRLVMPTPLSQSLVASPNVNMQRMSLPATRSPSVYGQFQPQGPPYQMQPHPGQMNRMPPPGIMSPPSAMGSFPPQHRPRPPSGPPPTSSFRPMPPMQPVHNMVKVQAQEIQFAPTKGGKLKKRVSMISTGPSSANSKAQPVLTTVSFAPPIIGFDRSVAHDKGLQRAMTEKVGSMSSSGRAAAPPPKRLLSKRR